MNYKKIAIVGLLGLTVGTTAMARDFGKSSDRLAKALELDEAQAAAVQEIFSSHREQAQSELETLLTPEQLEKLNTMREEKGDGKRGRKGKRSDSDA